LSLSERARLV